MTDAQLPHGPTGLWAGFIAGKNTPTASDRCHTLRPHSVSIHRLGNHVLT